MLMLDSGQAQARQMIEVSRTYLVYLNYFYPDWGHSAIYSRHYSLVVFCSKVSPKSQRWPCSIPACKMIGLNIDREHTYECIIYTLSHMKNMLKTPFSPCWRPSLCSKSGHCSLYIMFQPYSFEAMKQNLRYWVSCTHACASQYSSTLASTADACWLFMLHAYMAWARRNSLQHVSYSRNIVYQYTCC